MERLQKALPHLILHGVLDIGHLAQRFAGFDQWLTCGEKITKIQTENRKFRFSELNYSTENENEFEKEFENVVEKERSNGKIK